MPNPSEVITQLIGPVGDRLIGHFTRDELDRVAIALREERDRANEKCGHGSDMLVVYDEYPFVMAPARTYAALLTELGLDDLAASVRRAFPVGPAYLHGPRPSVCRAQPW